jgi:hypothetical protein
MAAANSLALTKRLADAYFTGSYKMLLVSSAPSESDLDTFAVRSSVANEVANSGTYASGGSSVTCTVGAVDTANNRVPVTFGAPAAWTSATISAVGGWIYKVIGSAATDELVSYVDFGGTITSTVNSFTVSMATPLYINR